MSITSPHGWTVKLECDEYEWVYRAYTAGLQEHGLPELAIDALPYEDDPYAEMEFGSDAMARVLDQVALAWEHAPLMPGEPIEVEAHEGWSILVDPLPPHGPRRMQAVDGVELRWKLAPAPAPAAVDVSDELAVELSLGIVALEACTPDAVQITGVDRPESVQFGQHQTYGPLTPWVIANARAMIGLKNVDVMIARMEMVAAAAPPVATQMALEWTAEPVLRSDALGRVRSLAEQVSRQLQHRSEWPSEVRTRATELGLPLREAREYLDGHLRGFVGNTLAGCALQDVMSSRLLLCALGGWRSIVSPSEDDAGSQWRCDGSTAATLRRFFAHMDEDGLVRVIDAIEEVEHTERADLRQRLIGSTLTGPSSPPPVAEIVGPELQEVIQFRGGRSYVDQLARLIAALCQPPRWMSSDDAMRERRALTDSIGVVW